MLRQIFKALGRDALAISTSGIDIDRVTYAVGDIHGRADLLDQILEEILADITAAPLNEPCRLIFLGDYVDRGPASAAVLARLAALPETLDSAQIDEIICLRGNHEVMLEEFLADPEGAAPRWFRNGGLETLLSFDVRGVRPGDTGAVLHGIRDRLVAALGPGRAWLDTLTSLAVYGNTAFSHAGGHPGRTIEDQSEQDLYWGSRQFHKQDRADGLWMVHGHYIHDEPGITGQRIAVDTGAYHSGRLTAARIAPGSVRFLST